MAEKEKSEKNTEKINRDKALDLALSQIEKQHGKGSIMRLGDERARQHILHHYSWDNVAESTAQLYRELTGGR